MLTEADRRNWQAEGFVVLRGFFSDDEVETVRDAGRRPLRERDSRVVVDDLETNQRVRASSLTDADLEHRFKVNDIYLTDPAVREVALSERLGAMLAELLEDEPVLINTLSLEHGTQQADHVDTLFMTPPDERGLVATWMALEDVHPDAGPLRYYPGSHRIDQHRFSDGGLHAIPDEMDQWAHHTASEVDRLGLAEDRLVGHAGDLFIWHAFLLHGGSEICSPGLTRRSMVSHFFGRADSERSGLATAAAPGGWWFERGPHAVPGEGAELDRAAPIPGGQPLRTESATAVEPGRPRSLFDRLRSLRTGRH